MILAENVKPLERRKRAIIYCRVSTDKQEQDGESLEYQEEKCRQYAALNNMDVLTVLSEVKSGFIHYSLRPKLTLAREFIRDHIADVIIVWDLRRFSRNFVHSSMIFQELEDAGGEVVSVSEKIDNSLQGKLIRAIIAWSAESEREKILEYANRHWKDRLEKGLPIGSGYKRYGWEWEDERKVSYVLNPEEAAVRFSIFHMFVELDMSLRAVCHKLTEDGILAPSIKRDPNTKRGRHWTHTTICDILRDEANKGVLIICKRQTVLDSQGKTKRIPHPQKKSIPGGLPRIVSATMFERAQQKLARNKVEQSHKPKDPTLFLLRGHVRCGSCGQRMCTRLAKGVPYYYCSNYRNKYAKCPDTPAVRADMVNPLAWDECCCLFERIESLQSQIEGEIRQAVTTLLEDTTGQEQITELQATIDHAKAERRKHEEGSYVYNLLTQDICTKEEQLKRFREECSSASSIAAATAIYQGRMIEFLEFLNVMRGKYSSASFQEKRNALDVLGVSVRLAAIPKEERRHGKVPTLDELKSRMAVTYSPIFLGAGVQPSGDGRPQNQ